jgi:stage II sporulation protein D
MDVTRLAATIFAALGLVASASAGHAYKVTKHAAATHRSDARQVQALPAIFVSGHGWGHGIGLAQYGAYGYALHGWSFDRIVAHYYPGTTLGQSDLNHVRVLLAPHAKRVVISSPSPFVVRDGKGKKHKLPAGEQAFGPGLKLKLAADKKPKALPGPLFFIPGTDPLSLGSKAYRGSLRVKKVGGSLEVVNLVGLEPYLWGVVPSEMPQRWPAEALAAQAVVARTYALAHLQKGGDFDLYNDTRSQVYGGIGAEAQNATDAVNETSGQVVDYDGQLADTFFFSSSGGKTANVQDVWPNADPVPYLVSVPDPYDTLSPYHDWGPLKFGAATLAKRLHIPGRVTDFRANVSSSGRVRTVTFVGSSGQRTVTGAAVRSALGLRSTWFHFGLISLSNPAGTVVYGSSATLSGVARGVSKVTLESRAYGGTWKRVARLAVRNGAVAPVVQPTVTTDYRLQSGGFRSASVRVPVAPLVQLSAGTDGVSVNGLVRPILSRADVQVQRQGSNGWETVAHTTVGSDGTYYVTLNLTPGSYRARVTAGRGFAVGLSDTLTVVAQ